MSREGRGRLSTIDLLPEACDPDIQWVLEELRQSKRLQLDILKEFNGRLADKAVAPISVGTFSRYSVRKSQQFRKLDESRRLSAELMKSLGAEGSEELTMLVGETIKTVALQLMDDGKIDSKGLMELARATQAAVQAQKLSTDHRAKLEKAIEDNKEEAIEMVAKEAGVPAERIAQMRREILGMSK